MKVLYLQKSSVILLVQAHKILFFLKLLIY